jgi:glycosyltransferase involved in cell wall biosynthesis
VTGRTPGRHTRKAWLVLPSLAGGGAERIGLTLAAGLRDTDYDPTLYLAVREGPFVAEAEHLVPVVASGTGSRIARIFHLRGHLVRAAPDVVVAFLSYAGPLIAARLSHRGAKVIFSIQTPFAPFLDDPDFPWGRPLNRAVFTAGMAVALRAADAVVVTSRGIADEVSATFRVPADRVSIIHNPIDLARIRAQSREAVSDDILPPFDGVTVVAAGRLAAVKNFPLLFEAFSRVRATMPARLIVLGGGELDASLRARVHELGLDDSVHLLGFQANPWKFMARADIFAMTSRYEGFGNVLIEAMALGLPVVATSSAGPREIVRHGENGLVVDAHEPEPIAAALMQILRNRDLHRRLAEGARITAEAFDSPIIIGEYVTLFDRLTRA